MPALIAFDLDGTLIDSRRDLADAANALIAELGGEPLSEDAIGSMVGEGAAVLVRRALRAARVLEPPDAVARFLALYDTRLLNHTRLYDGIIDAVHAARERALVIVFTNKPTRPSERILEGLGVRRLFADVIGGDNPYGRKPDPAALLALMKRDRVAPEHALMVGDSAIDHETSIRAGVRCCLVSFGFGYQHVSKDKLRADDGVAANASELRELLAKFGS